MDKSLKNKLTEQGQKMFIDQVVANQIFKEVEEGRAEKEGYFLVEGEYFIQPNGNLYMGGFKVVKIADKEKKTVN